MINKDLPLGFGMALAQHPEAMKKFSDMSEGEQEEILSKAHNVKSKQEMKQFVSNLAQN